MTGVQTCALPICLYLNNRAAEWLLQGDLDSAHAWAWAALAQAPDTGPAYTTLGVVYLRHGDLSAAESLLRQGLARHPDHPPLLANLAQALVRQGRAADAATVSDRLAQVEGRAPFADLQRGMAALRAGDAAEARRLFLRELARDPDYHEFHFALALAEARLGQPAVALRHLQLASDHSPQAGLRTLYSAKADHLREALAR